MSSNGPTQAKRRLKKPVAPVSPLTKTSTATTTKPHTTSTKVSWPLEGQKSPVASPFHTAAIPNHPQKQPIVPNLDTHSVPELKPSLYIKQRSLSISERLIACAADNYTPAIVELVQPDGTGQKRSEVPLDKPIFDAIPSKVLLQSYQPFQTYEIIITFRNNDKIARCIELEQIDNPYFHLTGMKNDSLQSPRVAPGMEVSFILKFYPEEKKDYSYNIVCKTEREKFLLPVQAIGARAVLDFPDDIVFQECPVRYTSSKTLLVRNIGDRPAKFALKVDPPFFPNPSHGYLDVDANLQIEMEFKPEKTGSFSKKMLLDYDTGEQMIMHCLGSAEDVNIRLEKHTLRLNTTFITLSSSNIIKIHNRSDIMAHFEWKQFANESEEHLFRTRKRAQVEAENEEEKNEFLKKNQDNKVALVDLPVLIQRHKNKLLELEKDDLFFDDAMFTIEPIEGTIWPNSFVEVTVNFRPNMAGPHSRHVFCQVSGRETRLPLQIKGEGIGPKARFSYDLLDVESVFINTKHTYEISFENQGDIDVHYSLREPCTLFASKFEFTPSQGILKVGEHVRLQVAFCSDVLGEFYEEFTFDLEGSPEPLVFMAKGRVVGPSFHFDQPIIDFGKMAYGFLSTKTVNIVNSSNIPMTFNLRLAYEEDSEQDGSHEFAMTPSYGTILPMKSQQIQLDFKPCQVGEYCKYLVVDVESVGVDLLRIPIHANSHVSEIKVKVSQLDYGDCYLSHPYHRTIELINESDLPARYLVMKQDENAKTIYAYGSKNAVGVIKPHSSLQVDLELMVKRLGPINFPIFIRIIGAEEQPLVVDILAHGLGPNISLSTHELNWGKIAVLREHTSILYLKNDAPIPAEFVCSTVGDHSAFKVEPSSGIIQSHEIMSLHVTALLDDCVKFTDILKINIHNDRTHEVQLVARGTGSTIEFDQGLSQIDFEDVFSHHECSAEFVMINRGRRTQQLYWQPHEKQKFSNRDSRHQSSVFEIIPARFLLKPGAQQRIVVRGYSSTAIDANETLICQSIVDKDPNRKVVVETNIKARFIHPLVRVSPTQLKFIASHLHEGDFKTLTKNIQLVNTSALPLHLNFKCPEPYHLAEAAQGLFLEPNETRMIPVEFDPSYHVDRISSKDSAKITITYLEHPQKDVIDLYSEVSFPNLTFSSSVVDFGCIPKDALRYESFNIVNSGTLPIYYNWYYLKDSIECDSSAPGIAQVFDILPLSGVLQPGQIEQVQVSFNGYFNGSFACQAICNVEGGPEYELSIKGETSSVEYQIDKYALDFGSHLYQDIFEQELTLSNTGRVGFDYSIQLNQGPLAQKLFIYPASGRVEPFEKQTLVVRYCSCVPEAITDHFHIQIAHFEPIDIQVTGKGTFPLMNVGLPRVQDAVFSNILAKLRSKKLIERNQNRKIDPTVDGAILLQEDLETDSLPEADRLTLKEKTTEFLARWSQDIKLKPSQLQKIPGFIGSTIVAHKSTLKDKKNVASLVECSQVELAKFVCDFGNVIRGIPQTRTFKVSNASPHTLTFQLDKSAIANSGFTIEPEKAKLAPCHGSTTESIEFTVTFASKSTDVGIVSMDIPVVVTGGPTMMITLKADVTVPDVSLSSKEVGFGAVLCGQRKTVAVRLMNTNHVPCEWSLNTDEIDQDYVAKQKKPKKRGTSPSGKRKVLDSLTRDITIAPSNGALQPGESVVLLLKYSPSEEKEFDINLPIHVNLNPKPTLLKLTGRGVQLQVEFDAESLIIGPVLPCSEGIEARFQVANPTDQPIEIFSLEFDQQYVDEEEILRFIEAGDEGVLYLPPRQPGEPLPDYIADPGIKAMKQEVVPSTEQEAITKPGKATISIPTASSLSSPSSDAHAASHNQDVYPAHIVLHGPPFSGRSSQAKRISKVCGNIYIKLDEVVENHRPDTAEEDKAHLDTADKQRQTTPTQHSDPSDEKRVNLPEETVIEILKARLTKEDCIKNGFVIDSLETKYLQSPLSLIKHVLKPVSEKRKLILFNLQLDVHVIHDREMKVLRALGDKDAELFQYKELSEREYEQLAESEKLAYESAMIRYKKRMKSLLDRRKNERRLLEEELTSKLGERKTEEEGKGGKKKQNRRTNPPPPNTKNEKNGKEGKPRAASPKLNKRTNEQKNADRFNEKGGFGVDRGLGDRVDVEDISSRLALLEMMDIFFSDATYRRFEHYFYTMESLSSWLKEQDKVKTGATATLAPAPPAQTTLPVDKKLNKFKNVVAAGLALTNTESNSSGINNPDVEHPVIEEPSPVQVHEVQANGDEEAVFKAISEFVAHVPKASENNEAFDKLPPPFLEQVVDCNPDRHDILRHPRYFTLLPPTPNLESDDDQASVADTAPQLAVNPTTKPGQSDTKKSSKGPSKAAVEEMKEAEEEAEKEIVTKYRWILQPHEKKELVLKFASGEIGRFEQSLNFEIVGCSGRTTLHCIGLCQHSQILWDHKKIFGKWRKVKEDKMIVHGEYIAGSSTYEFGPLLCAKPREKYMEKFPENRMSLAISNTSNTEIKINFALRNDIKGDTFFFDPANMELLPGQTQNLNLWAYPRGALHYEDTLICCVKDNPEPYICRVACDGVKPELEIDKKFLAFDKLLLGRKDQREIKLKNNTLMPVSWRLLQVDSLGEEFEVKPLEGMLEPYQEGVITATFHGSKPVVVKRVVRMEVFDTERIGGVVMEVPILVTAEAYDISMDLHFPKGYDGVDFGVLKVLDEGKQLCSLKNKGKYEVGYKFIFESKDFSDILTVTPQQGIMPPSDKPFSVQVVLKTVKEMTWRDVVAFRCQFYEPSTSEVTATTPVKVCARVVYSKFSILPVRDLNFGSLLYGTKGSRQFVIENLGEFDFRYSIYKILQGSLDSRNKAKPITQQAAGKGNQKPIRPTSPPPTKQPNNKREFVKQADAANIGAFTVFPTSGLCPSGQKQQITVEFHTESPGSYEETIAIDISDRSTADVDPVEYRLVGESCIPGINTTDFSSIFEEQTLCKRLELFNSQGNVYAEEDRVFYFGAFLAGQMTQAKIKISNPFKVPCEVSISTRPRSRTKSDASDFCFDVEPKKMTIQSHEYKYAVITFHPTSIQSYAGIFEAVVENVVESKHKMLTFELRGEGTLPRVSIEAPSLKTKNNLNTLKFKRLFIGNTQTLPLVIKNEGMITAKIKLEWVIRDGDDFECNQMNTVYALKPLEVRSFDVKCRPSTVKKLEAELKLRVLDNSFEDTSILLNGEGYADDFTFDNLPDASENELNFRDCSVREVRQQSFVISNHSPDYIRVACPELPDFSFSPALCHIKPKGSKEITVSYCARQPCDIPKLPGIFKLARIRYVSVPSDLDWDDRPKKRMAEADKKAGYKVLPEHANLEPAHEVTQTLQEFTLFLSAFADIPSFELDIQNIQFKPTYMYQTRVFQAALKNTGKVVFKYSCLLFNQQGQQVNEECPFSVNPGQGSAEPGETIPLSIKFCPQEEGEYNYHMVCMIPNAPKTIKPSIIRLNGSSIRPFCHFELETSNYINNERLSHSEGRTGELDQNTQVIEFESCGVKVKNTKRFYILNPTAISWDFEWENASGTHHRIFKCNTLSGTVLPMKKFEIVFEFTPEAIDLQESLWKFHIKRHTITVPFLLVGKAIEPNVFMDKSSVNFKSLLVGRHVKETVRLINNEKIPFSFNFSETSFEVGQDGTPVVKFAPVSGTVGPMSEIPIDIVFTPWSEKMYNFNLMCHVKKKPTPVAINVKGEGYKVHETLQGEAPDGTVFDLVSGLQSDNILDFGQVQMNDKRIKRVTIINSGKFNFDFSWKFLKSHYSLAVTPDMGTVAKGERIQVEIVYSPTTASPLKNMKLVCHIVNGRSYPISIQGTGIQPLLKFSKKHHDFGTQFIHRAGLAPVKTTIMVQNDDTKEVSLDIIAPESSVFEVQRGTLTLAPGANTFIEVTFIPRDSQVYSDVIKVEINGLSTEEIVLQGQGTLFRLDLAQQEQQHVNLGAVRIGHTVTRTVKLVNKSVIPVTFHLGPSSTLEALSLHNAVTVSPLGEMTVRPKGHVMIDFKFTPTHRIASFHEEILLETPGYTRPLLVVQGACQGIDIKLESDTLPFGAVVQKSCTTRRLQLQNVGDIGAKFHWNAAKFKPDFTISPSEGYISPGMDIPLDITFHPSDIHPDIRYENLQCIIENASPLFLTLTGMCVAQPAQSEAIKFATAVRQAEVKGITLTNKTSTAWRLYPVIENDYWSGLDVVEVEAGQSKTYDVQFLPLEMTGDGGKHEGSIFFPLPDGTGILYKLVGVAEKPSSSGTINRELPCKTTLVELLNVQNWLKRTQRFKVTIEMAKPDPSVVIKGHDFVDVPPLCNREYKLNFYAYKEGVTNVKVTFKNEQTQEFLYYHLTFKSTAPGVMATLDMTTVARQAVTRELTISNPLTVPVSFSASCSHTEITVPHAFTVQPKQVDLIMTHSRSDGIVPIEFVPLVPKDSTARLTLTSAELGVYQYDLKLIASQPPLERSIHFKVGLGGSQLATFRFNSFAKQKTEYICKIDSTEFFVEKSITAPPAVNGSIEVCVDIMYEPSRLGDVRTTLIVSSSSGGDYVCPLYGYCTLPRPQGPILVKPGTLTSVPFKNVFSTSSNFIFVVDNPAFTVKASESIGAKKTITMTIGYKASDKGAQAKVGKLTVTHPSTNIAWVYYLKI